MKRTLYILLIPFLLLNCKKEKEPTPPPAIKELIGKWRLQAVEKTINGQTVWEEVPASDGDTFTIRFDGILLGSDGLPPCCGLGTYSIDGIPYVPKPQAEVPYNAQCALIYCASCPRNINVENDALIVASTCEGSIPRSKYVRQ